MGKRKYVKKNILGNVYGSWTVIAESERKNKSYTPYWICKCKCGIEREVIISALFSGKSKSCGCSRLVDNRREKFFSTRYVVKENGCWEWVGGRDKNGYPLFGVRTKGHRYSYERFKGPIPKGLCVCHNCPGGDNKGCVNPEHLWIGTHAENIHDKKPKGKQNFGENHGRKKLNEKDVLDIKRRFQAGELGTKLAKEYGVSSGLIYHIKDGLIWRHLCEEEQK